MSAAEAAKDAAIRYAAQRSAARAVGVLAMQVDFAADRVHVTIHAARPGVARGFLAPWRPSEFPANRRPNSFAGNWRSRPAGGCGWTSWRCLAPRTPGQKMPAA